MNFSLQDCQSMCFGSSTDPLPIAFKESKRPQRSHHRKCAVRIVVILVACMNFLSLTGAATPVQNELENGIYLQETVGDLPKAIDAFKKVVSESDDALAVAAEAQFRIGDCYARLGKDDKSTAAWEAVVSDYLGQTKWVKLAKSKLNSELKLLPFPWGAGDELQFKITLPNGMDAGYQVWRIGSVKHKDVQAWKCTTQQTITINNQQNKSHVIADQQTFAPIESSWRHTILGTANATFKTGEAVVTMVGKDAPKKLKYDGLTFDNEQAAEVFRCLDMKVGQKDKINLVTSIGMTFIPLPFEVTGMKTVKCAVGEFECFVLELSIGQTFYVANNPSRYIVGFDGGGIEARLVKVITADQFEKPVQVDTDGFDLTLPAGWHAFSQPSPKHKDQYRVRLVDPDNSVDAWVEFSPIAALKKNQKYESPQQWVEKKLDDAKEHHKDVTIGGDQAQAADSKQDSGATAAEGTFEYKDGDRGKVGKLKSIFGKDVAVCFSLTHPKEDAKKLSTELDSIMSSIKLK